MIFIFIMSILVVLIIIIELITYYHQHQRDIKHDEETGEEMVVKGSRRGPFLAAKNYPEVKIAKNIPKDVGDELNLRLAEKQESEVEA